MTGKKSSKRVGQRVSIVVLTAGLVALSATTGISAERTVLGEFFTNLY
jgi:hypothetical protein